MSIGSHPKQIHHLLYQVVGCGCGLTLLQPASSRRLLPFLFQGPASYVVWLCPTRQVFTCGGGTAVNTLRLLKLYVTFHSVALQPSGVICSYLFVQHSHDTWVFIIQCEVPSIFLFTATLVKYCCCVTCDCHKITRESWRQRYSDTRRDNEHQLR